jgi:hypothetical protein
MISARKWRGTTTPGWRELRKVADHTKVKLARRWRDI